MFIVIEGVDGSGKDTQLKMLINYLIDSDKYLQILKQREPSQITESGRRINELSQKKELPDGLEATKLFAKDRIEMSSFRREILNDSWIVCSRFDYSTYAYQGAQGVSFDDMLALHDTSGLLIPDVTFFLDISIETMLQRVFKDRGGDLEAFEQEDFLKSMHEKYQEVLSYFENKRNIVRINGEGSIDEVHKQIRAYFEAKK